MKILDTRACEFGYELIMVLPHAYYLYKNNIDFKVITCVGMEPFYYFLADNQLEIKYNKRRGAIPTGTPLKNIHFNKLDKTEWIFPPLKEKYISSTLNITFEKELLIISNKFTTEWGHAPINFLSLKILDILFEKLTPHYTLVYNRPLSKNIIQDHSSNMDLGDYDLIKNKYPSVLDINNIHNDKQIDYNKLQLILGANTTKHISVQGGNSILSSLFGGVNIVYAKKGGEVTHNSYKNWYGEFSGATVINVDDYSKLMALVQKYFLHEKI
jgi:hypothetical protein